MLRLPSSLLFKRAGTAVLCSTALFACSTSPVPLSSVSDANATVVAGYQVGPGDKLRVTVFDEPALSGEYQLGEDGSLALPLIGQLAAVGQTPGSLADSISTGLRAGGYVLEPRVSVEVLQYRPFFILGEVNRPGEYEYSGDLTLSQAVAKAGGYTTRASTRSVELQRQLWSAPRRVRLDSATLMIAPGDTITIPEAFF